MKKPETKYYVITDQNHDYGIPLYSELTAKVRAEYKTELPDCEFYAFTVDENDCPETWLDPVYTW